MAMPQAESLQLFVLQPSKLEHRFILGVHLLALLALLWLPLAWLVLGVTGLALGLCWQLWQYKRKPLISLRFAPQSGWAIVQADSLTAIDILPSTVVSRWVVVLHTRHTLSQQWQALLCFQDALPLPEFKQLIVCLKIYAASAKA